MKTYQILASLGAAALSLGSLIAESTQLHIIPTPTSVESKAEQGFQINKKTRIYISDDTEGSEFAAGYFADKIKSSTGLKLKIKEGVLAEPNSIHFIKTHGHKPGMDEGYKLDSSADRVFITATTDAGLFYGAITLLQLLPAEIESQEVIKGLDLTIPAVMIEDKPRFSWRGMHLDVSRHFFPKEDILTYLDILASYKINRFHWHLIDDGGWRLEIKQYPRLTSVGAWRNHESFKWNSGKIDFVRADDPNVDAYGGFYTQEDVREIVAYAAERNIVVVPEIEMPGHIMPALAAYPELGSHPEGGYYTKDRLPEGMDRETYTKRGWGYYHQNVADAGKDFTYEFFKNVLDETFELFPSKWIHIGGDEVQKHYWENSPWVSKLMEAQGLHDQHEVQSYFLKKMNKHIVANGRRMVGWDEIVDGGLAPDATVMYWIGGGRMMQALKAGHDVVMSPMGPSYFDFAYRNNSTRKMHDWDPMPADAPEDKREFLIGAQANVWTEWMENWDRVEYMVLPRMTALAETTWNTPERKNWDNFHASLNQHFARMDFNGYNYRLPTPTAAWSTVLFKDSEMVALDPVPSAAWTLRYTTDGSKPTAESTEYTGPIKVSDSLVIKAAYFAGEARSSEIPLEVHCRKYTPSKPSGLQPGVNFTYHELNNPKNTGQLKGDNKVSEGNQSDFSLAARKRNDNFGMIFNGYIKIEQDGLYNFATYSDDGSVLKIADTIVVNNDGLHGYVRAEGSVNLKAGYYPLEVRFVEAGGAERLDVFMQAPGGKEKPLTELFRN